MREQFTHQIPATLEEVRSLGWDGLDIILITGDAHVDHSSFPAALLGRVLLNRGFRVGVIARPDVTVPESVAVLGMPALFFGVTGGALDSMVANYTASRRRRSDDPYAPGGGAGGRPDRAVTVYCNLLRRVFGKSAFIVAGGLEAGLRKFAHYDYWSDSIRRPLLMDCGADVLVHGMGEGPIVEIGERLRALMAREPELAESRRDGEIVDQALQVQVLKDVPGLVYREAASLPAPGGDRRGGVSYLPSVEEVQGSGPLYAAAFAQEWSWSTGVRIGEAGGRRGEKRGDGGDKGEEAHRAWYLCQPCGGMRVIANRAWEPPFPSRLDEYYNLPFTRNVHPVHGTGTRARVPALEQVRFSVTSHRGCAGGCSFCSITAHQGREITSRSPRSIIKEVESMGDHPMFKGIINDVGGPSANMYGLGCTRGPGVECRRVSCLWPSVCRHFSTDCTHYGELLERVRLMDGIRRVFVTTGVRMDLANQSPRFIKALARHHTSGLLKVAPEHVVPRVLDLMYKPRVGVFRKFLKSYLDQSRQAGKKQYVLPYFMAAHPGCTLDHMVEVALEMARENLRVEQCQIFTPTPGTAATVMYATGLNPFTMEPVFVERDPRRKELQKALILAHLPENRGMVMEALSLCGRQELAEVLLPGRRGEGSSYSRGPGPKGRCHKPGPRRGQRRTGHRSSARSRQRKQET